jgi:large subunit GTPase 1
LTLLSPATEDTILTGDSEQRRQDLDPIVEGGGDQQDGMDEEVDDQQDGMDEEVDDEEVDDEEVDDEDNDVDEGGGEED